jgi:hypothetical protein
MFHKTHMLQVQELVKLAHNLETYLLQRVFLFYILFTSYHRYSPVSPNTSHPITMTPTALTSALADAKAAFLPIIGQPTNDNLVRINDALTPILLTITCDRINGKQSLLGLIANVDRYLHHYGFAFIHPTTHLAVYDPNIANDVSCIERVCAEASWATCIQDYEAYEAAESDVKVFIEAVVEDTWICDLHDPLTFYSNISALALLNHLCACSGGLHALDMVLLIIQMSQFYKGAPNIPKYIQLLKDAQRKMARAGLPVTNQPLTALASTVLLAADTFPRTTDIWEELDPVDKIWPAWKTAYLDAHKRRVDRLRATGVANNLGRANPAQVNQVSSSLGHRWPNNLGRDNPAQANQATNFLDSIDNALDNLASATTNDKAVLKKLVATNSSLTTSNTNLANLIKTLQTQLNAKKNQGGNGGGGSGGSGGGGSGGSNNTSKQKGPNPAGYCLSHGWRVGYGHNSTTCANQKEGPQCNATRQNTKGGSSANKDWTSRCA